ncbi:MAG: helix-turn-helix transcriptional regulator [Chloroflexales bacterium]|nr:helix-turn-helix transcriptional regulator [Chloroflexales bacterium]
MAVRDEESGQTPSAQGTIPLRAPTFFILLSLAPGVKHGYAILKDVAALSEGTVVLSAGTLYEALGRLLTQGLVARADDDDRQRAGPPRKAYHLTNAGRQALETETNRMDHLVALARHRLAREEP